MDQKEFNKIMSGMEEVNRKMVDDIYKNAPMCHFRKMNIEEADTSHELCKQWWECSVCGHTEAL